VPENISDSYLTLKSSAKYEIKIKGSRFIALGHPIVSEEEALSVLEEIKKREHAANHHCFAYVVGLDDDKYKYSDAGEPSGTAGRPIYQAIEGRRLKNVLVVVVRYFGGTKLGTGGLARAYSRATTEMLDAADIVEKLICDRIRFDIHFGYYDRVIRLITRGRYRIISQDFAEQVTFELEIRKSHTDDFIARLVELTGGKIDVARTG